MTEERADQDPLIIAGGLCSANPEPLADMIDVFVIGDGETAFPELIRHYKRWKTQAGKQDLLKMLCRLPGVYVPAFYAVHTDNTGQIQAMVTKIPEAPVAIERAVEPDLNAAAYFQAPLIPYLKTVRDRLTLEIMRAVVRVAAVFVRQGFFIVRNANARKPLWCGWRNRCYSAAAMKKFPFLP